MTRAEAAAWIDSRYGAYLEAAGRGDGDAAGELSEVIDDALLALGYAADEISTAEPTEAEAVEDLRVQLAYRAMLQITRDLGATSFDVGLSGNSFRLGQIRVAAEKDLAITSAAVLARFGTLGVVPTADGTSSPFVTINLNYLEERGVAWRVS